MNNFNLIAPFYDFFFRLVFGKSLFQLQRIQCKRIKSTDSILILGGGTGKIIEFIPKCKKIVFLEKSKKMIFRARNRNLNQEVFFIQTNFLKYDFNEKFDVIICPFFLDCFNIKNLRRAIIKCKGILKERGTLIINDFQHTFSNKIFLISMHLFFRLFANLESNGLKNIHQELIKQNFGVMEKKFLFQNQIFCFCYKNM